MNKWTKFHLYVFLFIGLKKGFEAGAVEIVAAAEWVNMLSEKPKNNGSICFGILL